MGVVTSVEAGRTTLSGQNRVTRFSSVSREQRMSQFQWETAAMSKRTTDNNVVLLWNKYIDRANVTSFNLFTPLMLVEPVTVEIFKLDKGPLDSNFHFARHVHLVHFCLDYCIKLIINNDFNQCTMALSSLGAIHAMHGVSATSLITFARSAVTAIQTANRSDATSNLGNVDEETIRDAIIAVVQAMINGIKNHQTKADFVFSTVEGRCSWPCWSSKVRKVKTIDRRAHLSMYNLVLQLRDND